ncbi:hypothetical protein MNBD_GAMMA21-1039 [hydrothermal vent metagenome]|uniref:DUF3012 domain-containing protein n=1 Tax=hydrothermal vent metagenome TaxID=652676 RepID=A0A3B1ADY8_9ZZZZ
MKLLVYRIGVIMLWFSLTACTPEIGSEQWCEELKEKPKGEWTVNEVGDFTKYCLFK